LKENKSKSESNEKRSVVKEEKVLI